MPKIRRTPCHFRLVLELKQGLLLEDTFLSKDADLLAKEINEETKES